jgi:solute carrier family 15 oligopeptide transporter 1
VLIAIGTGGIKPCVCSFGGDQFQLPEQQTELTKFFNRFVTSVYIGSLISTFISPELRNSTQCFGRDTCFPLAFGVLSLLMTIAIGNLLSTSNYFTKLFMLLLFFFSIPLQNVIYLHQIWYLHFTTIVQW